MKSFFYKNKKPLLVSFTAPEWMAKIQAALKPSYLFPTCKDPKLFCQSFRATSHCHLTENKHNRKETLHEQQLSSVCLRLFCSSSLSIFFSEVESGRKLTVMKLTWLTGP